jgi:hypothetical protein
LRRAAFLILLTLAALAVEPPPRWWARGKALLRDARARGCLHAAPASLRAPPPSAAAPPRLLLCMPAAAAPGSARFALTLAAVRTYLAYSRFTVVVAVDVASQATADALAAAFPAAAAAGALRTRVWAEAALVAQWPLATGWLTGEPPAYLLSHAHRLTMATPAVLASHDWFAYAEDDMLVPEAAFVLAAERAAELWPRGWLAGFVRVENDTRGAPVYVDLLPPDLVAPRVFVVDADAAEATATAAGPGEPRRQHAYVHFSQVYAAAWILARAQLDAFVAEPSGVFAAGSGAFDVRARMSLGYSHALAPDGRWVPRILLPLADGGEDGRRAIDPRARILHLPSNYCGFSDRPCSSFDALDRACSSVAAELLGMHEVLPCTPPT